MGEGTDGPVSLRMDPSWEEHGLPSDPSWTDNTGHAGVSVEILSTMLDKQSRLDTTEFLVLRLSGWREKERKKH